MSQSRRHLARGLGLIEVLTAVALLSFLLMPVFQLVLNAGRDVRRTEDHLKALFYAQRRLEEALLLGPDDAGRLPPTDIDGFHLEVDVAPFNGAADLHDLIVTVRWKPGPTSATELRLRTLACKRSL